MRQATMSEIQSQAPKGAEEYFIDYDSSVWYLKEDRTYIYSPYIGWEEFDTEYQKNVTIHPVFKELSASEFVAYYGVDKAKELRGNTSNALLCMGHYNIHVNDIDEAIKAALS